MVAMFGWIIPAPLVMLEMEKVVFGEDGRMEVRDASLGRVSVVHMPQAASVIMSGAHILVDCW